MGQGGMEGPGMWARMAVGAVAGLVVGHFTRPGYALWLTAGITAGYAAELWAERSRERKQKESEPGMV